MQKCDVCGANIDYWNMASSIDDKDIPNNIFLCKECYNKLKKIEDGDGWALNYFNSQILTIKDNEKRQLIEDLIYTKQNSKQKTTLLKEKTRLYEENLRLFDNPFVTSGYGFEGYKITEYKGVISGESVLGTYLSETFAITQTTFLEKIGIVFPQRLKEAKTAALKKLYEEAAAKGANAIIGLDLDYITLYESIMGVIANGIAVKIEKI